MDESGFSLGAIRRKCWGKKGKRKRLAGERRKGRVNVMRFLRCSDKKRFVQFVKKEIQKHSSLHYSRVKKVSSDKNELLSRLFFYLNV